ncbi:MAG: polyprenyl diphosphate synthase, partial [Phycisphaeraceae bacterium]
RSREEIDTLMELYVAYLESERQLFFDNNVRFNQIGRRDGLPTEVLDALDRMKADTAGHDGLTMTLALNYGSRAEITDAVRAIADKVAEGALASGYISEQTIADHLYTADLPDPDLLIRTAGEMRLSNYLLWQLSYAEFVVTDVCWPDFTIDELNKALASFKGRTRRFGGVV